eukprot:5249875-Pyramimonas_sp.AAC.1
MVTRSARRQSSSVASARAAEASSRYVIGGSTGARSPSLSCRSPGCSGGAGAPWRRAEMLPL